MTTAIIKPTRTFDVDAHVLAIVSVVGITT
jgi:hypothetical protein